MKILKYIILVLFFFINISFSEEVQLEFEGEVDKVDKSVLEENDNSNNAITPEITDIKTINNVKIKKKIKNTDSRRFVNTAKLMVLNKITGRTSEIDVEIDKSIMFENIEILPIVCWKSYPEENPENKLLLKVYELEKGKKNKKLLFFGWIFSSSYSISGLEHPMYDINLKDCKNVTDN